MNLCIGERLDAPGWHGLPLGRFAPPGHASMLPVAAAQDTLFVWKNGASSAHVRSRRSVQHYARHLGVLDIMAADEEAFIAHDAPEAPGECLLVALPPSVREAWVEGAGRRAFRSRFDLADPLVVELACALERQCLQGEPLGALFTESMSTALVAAAVAAHAEHGHGTAAPFSKGGSGRLSTAQQARVYRYMEEHLGDDIRLADLAQLTGYSPAHFLRLFRHAFGQTPHQFLVQLRVERAKQLLRGDGLSVAQIACACGFASQSHFGTAFMRRVGVSPTQYRRAPSA